MRRFFLVFFLAMGVVWGFGTGLQSLTTGHTCATATAPAAPATPAPAPAR